MKPASPLAPTPQWFLSLVSRRQEHAHALPQPVRFAPSGTHFLDVALARAAGRRDDTGFWLACQLRDDGFSEAEAAVIMKEYAIRTPQGDHPYTEADAMRNLRSAFSRPPRERARRKDRW